MKIDRRSSSSPRCSSARASTSSPAFPAAPTCRSTTRCTPAASATCWRATSRARASSPRAWRAPPAARPSASAPRARAPPTCSRRSPTPSSTRSRCVAITGQVPRAMIGTDAFQEIDTYGLTIPITKHNYLVRSAAELLDVIPDAFRVAASGRPGPVVIDVPKDVQNETIELDALPDAGRRRSAAAAASRRHRARRGAHQRGAPAGAAHRRRHHRRGRVGASCGSSPRTASIPVAATLLGLGAHAARSSALPRHGRHARGALHEPPARRVRSADRARHPLRRPRHRQGRRRSARGAKIVHVDIDASELGKIKQPFLGIEADVGAWLRALAAAGRAERRAASGRARMRAAARRASAGDARRRRSAAAVRHRAPHRRARRRRRDRHQRRRPASDVGRAGVPVHAAAPVADLGRPRHDGLRLAGGDRRGARRARSARWSASPATAAC